MAVLEPLVETHNEAEFMAANELKLPIIGINNRNIAQLKACPLFGFMPGNSLNRITHRNILLF